MRFVPYFVASSVLYAIVAWLVAGGRTRRTIGLTLAAVGLVQPLLMPGDVPAIRFVFALSIAMAFLRTIDLARDRKARTYVFRLLHVITPFDTRRMPPATPRFSGRALGEALAYALFTAASIYALLHVTPTLDGPARTIARWVAGLVFAYAITDVVYGGFTFALRAGGVDIYELHRAPALSLSVKGFWGERWNRTVSAWLSENCLRPLARRGMVRFGVFASFLVSATLHGYLVLVSISGWLTLLMFGYFLLQGAAVLMELKLRATKWNKTFARAWTIGFLVVTSPMFVEPTLRVLGL